jgi:hypothetical protein
MTVLEMAVFLADHPEWSPCMRLLGNPENPATWGVMTVGLVSPGGMVVKLPVMQAIVSDNG